MTVAWSSWRERGRIALVLAGGGARGAYEAGVIAALAEHGFEPDLVAGTSIGALNGAVIAQADGLSSAARELDHLWEKLGEADVIQIDVDALRDHALELAATAAFAQWIAPSAFRRIVRGISLATGRPERSLFNPAPIEQLLRSTIDPGRLRRGRPLWAAVARATRLQELPLLGKVFDSVRCWKAADVQYLPVHEIGDDEEVFSALLGSAAIPIAFPARDVGGGRFMDGGVVDNVPLAALTNEGCALAVIVHLSNATTWNRRDPAFQGVDVLEIRPLDAVQTSETPLVGWMRSVIDFRPASIARLLEAGRRDGMRVLTEIGEAIDIANSRRRRHAELITSTETLAEDRPLARPNRLGRKPQLPK